MVCQSRRSHFEPDEGAPINGSSIVVICISFMNTVPSNFLAIKETRRKWARFRAGNYCIPYPHHYRAAFASSGIPIPQRHRPISQSAVPLNRERYGVSTFPFEKSVGLDACYRPERSCSYGAVKKRPTLCLPAPFWLKPVNHFCLL